MPTVETFRGMRIVIYPNDHRPGHVHVMGKGHEAVFWLHCPKGPPELRENYGFSRRDVTAIAARIVECLDQLCKAWSAIHGSERC